MTRHIYPKALYVCATCRRKPGSCPNTLRLPIDYTDDVVLEMIEGEVLGQRYIEELLAMVGHIEVDHTGRLTSDRDRLRGEVERLVASIASGVSPAAFAPAIREREAQIAQLEVKLRQPHPVAPDVARLREALTQRAAEWKQILRSEPKVARLLLRRLIGPLVMVDESTRPDFIEAVADVKPALLDGIHSVEKMASPAGFEPVSWP